MEIGKGSGPALFKLIQTAVPAVPRGPPRKSQPQIVSNSPWPAHRRPGRPRRGPRPARLASPAHPVAFGRRLKQGLPKRFKGPGLGFGADLFDNGPMQEGPRATGLPAVARPLVQLQTAHPRQVELPAGQVSPANRRLAWI